MSLADNFFDGSPFDFGKVDEVTEAYLIPIATISNNNSSIGGEGQDSTDPSNLGKDVITYEGISKYKVHIPELMPTLDYTNGIWCDNTLMEISDEECPSSNLGGIGKMAGGMMGKSLGGAIGGPVGAYIGGQIGEKAGEQIGNNMKDGTPPRKYTFKYTKLPVNTKVIVRFLDNDINTAHIIAVLPFDPSDNPRQFIDNS